MEPMTLAAPASTLPAHACHLGTSPVFTQRTVPVALRERHALAPRNWARLVVLSGELSFVDLDRGTATTLRAGARHTIAPEAPHRVSVGTTGTFRLHFYRERQ